MTVEFRVPAVCRRPRRGRRVGPGFTGAVGARPPPAARGQASAPVRGRRAEAACWRPSRRGGGAPLRGSHARPRRHAARRERRLGSACDAAAPAPPRAGPSSAGSVAGLRTPSAHCRATRASAQAAERAGGRPGRDYFLAAPRAPPPEALLCSRGDLTLRLKRGHHRGRGGGAAPGIPRGIRRRARHARRIRAARKARASAGDGGAGRGRRLAWPGARRPHALRAAGGPPRPPLGAEAQVRKAGRHARVWGGGVHGEGHGGSGARDAGEDGAAGLGGRSWSRAPTSGHTRAARARAVSTARSLTAVGILCLLAFLPEAFFPGFYFKIRGARVPCVLTGESNVFYLFYLVTQESQGH